MSSITDPSTEYTDMGRPGSIPTKASSSSNVTVELGRLDDENPPAPAAASTSVPAPAPAPQAFINFDANQQHRPYHHTNYVVMTSELPPDRFEDEYDAMVGDEDYQSMAHSKTESVMTADGIHDVTGFNIVCMVILVGDMSRGVFFPTMWPLVSALGGTTVTLGYSVAAFSFGRIIVSPLFGAWSETYGYRMTLLTSCAVLLLGTFLHAQVQNVGRPGFLIFSQTILGVGSGTLGVTRAYVAAVTAQRNRTSYMAWITAVQYAGFTVTPFIGSFFIAVFQEVDFRWGFFRWNMYTAPAYFMSVVVGVILCLLVFIFQDQTVRNSETNKKNKKKSTKRAAIDDHANQMTITGFTVYDCCIFGCMLLNVSTKGNIGVFETLGVSIAESHFGLYSAEAGVIVASCGTIGVFSLLSMGYLARYLTDIQLICGGMVVMSAGIMSLAFLEDDDTNPSWKYIVAIFMLYSIGYPIGHTAVIGLFSKIVGRRPQGELLGWFASAGSLARLLFPIMSGYITKYAGISVLFYIMTGVLVVSTIITMYNRHTLTILSE